MPETLRVNPENKEKKAVSEKVLSEINQELKKETTIDERNHKLLEIGKALFAEKLGFNSIAGVDTKDRESVKFLEEDLQTSLHADPEDKRQYKDQITWRGDGAQFLLSILADNKPLKLESPIFNTDQSFRTSIAYGGEMREGYDPDEDQNMFQMAIGFLPNKESTFLEADEIETDLEDAAKIAEGMRVFNGEISKEDIQYVVVRAHGTKAGEIGKTYLFSKPELKQNNEFSV